MKILIAGGAGFIGSTLVSHYLKNKKNEIYIIDNLSTGKLKNIENFIYNNKVNFINEDISNSNIIPFIKNNNFDYIYNLACPASPKYYLKHPIETWESSILGTRNILNAIKGSNTKLLQTSTSEVYGDAKVHPQSEDYWGNVNCSGIRACYDEGKRAAESLIYDYIRVYNIKAAVVRIFNTYGPNMDKNDGRIISNFINQSLSNNDITIYGNGMQTRSFCYIDDTISALTSIMEKSYIPMKPINIGNPNEIQVLDLANLIQKMTKSNSKIVFKQPMTNDPQKRKPDISYIKSLINWEPKVDLITGLKKCIEYYNNIK